MRSARSVAAANAGETAAVYALGGEGSSAQCGGCGNSWGGAARATVMSYVGTGCGDYIQETNYKYVGQGEGEFEVRDVPDRVKICMWIGGGCCCLLLVALLVLCLFLWIAPATTSSGSTMGSSGSTTTFSGSTMGSSGSTMGAYSCGPGAVDMAHTDQVNYCCEHNSTHAYCKQQTSPPTPMPYDCDAGLSNALEGWSAAKKAYCCNVAKKGCPVVAAVPPAAVWHPTGVATPEPYNCGAQIDDWANMWSDKKKEWCCLHHTFIGCPYDCNIDWDLGRWRGGWSTGKKAYCCRHANRGCPEFKPLAAPPLVAPVALAAPPAAPAGPAVPHFDCGAGFQNWIAGWSVAKKVWCCYHENKGCALPGKAAQRKPPTIAA